MHWIDFSIFGLYMLAVLGIGVYFFKKNENREDYYVGGRSISAFHIGLSIAATDVGGGFSIGLGGLGYMIGLSGSWLLFTGIVGAWLSAVLIIPKIKKIDRQHKLLTFPDFLRLRYDERVAAAAAIISAIGYLGFTGAQVLAGAKLASATIFAHAPLGFDPFQFSILIIAVVIILYTVLGGLKAVIFTDTVQWIILFSGLIFLAIPFALYKIGGFSVLLKTLPAPFFSLTNLSFVKFFNWMVTIVPIWFVAMTIYQRIYASKNVKEAKKAWYIGGLFEYPLMAFTGVFLGLCSRVLFTGIDGEMGIPLLIRDVLPVGIAGIITAAYFSAIMSTADSCLVASSSNFVNDIIHRYFLKKRNDKQLVRLSQWATLFIGLAALVIALSFKSVLDAILLAYSFMVSGLLVPTLGAYFLKKNNSSAAFWAMLAGGSTTIIMIIFHLGLPFGIDQTVAGIFVSAVVFFFIPFVSRKKAKYPGLSHKPGD
jgi:SSS family solute:Na+ symporter